MRNSSLETEGPTRAILEQVDQSKLMGDPEACHGAGAPPNDSRGDSGLRGRVLRGGSYLAIRQGTGTLVNLVGVLCVTRLIGPTAYGAFATAFGISTFLFGFSQLGANVYLLRKSSTPTRLEYDQAFTIVLFAGLFIALVVGGSSTLIERWTRITGVASLTAVMLAALPFQLTGLVASAHLERELDYRRVAIIDFCSQLALYSVAIPLAMAGMGAWAPALGFLAQQLASCTALHVVSRYRPSIRWDGACAKEMIRFGLGYSVSMWVWQLRDLVNALIVSKFAGAAAVAFVSIAIRLVTALSFIKTATWRLSIAVLAKLKNEPTRLLGAVSEAMTLQVLAAGPVLLAFDLMAGVAMPALFGRDWLPVTIVYPFIAIGSLTNAVFSLHTAVLYVTDHNSDVTIFHTVHVILFAGSALVLVPLLGVRGYGWSEIIAIASYPVIHALVRRRVGAPSYRLAGLWWSASVIALLWRQLGIWCLCVMLVPLLWPGTREALRRYTAQLRRPAHA